MRCAICYHLYNLKKQEKHPWRGATFSKAVSNAVSKVSCKLKVKLLHGCFSRFLNCRNGTTSH